MFHRVVARLLVAAVAVISAAPAFAQTADLAVTLTIAGEDAAATKGFAIGGTKTFTAKIENPSSTLVTEFTLDATLAAALKVASVTGCTPVTPDNAFPCNVKPKGFQASGTTPGSVEVTFDVEYVQPKTLPTACPVAADTYAVTVTVAGAKSGNTAVPDAVPANDSATASTFLRPFADLEVTALEGPGSAGEGETIKYVTHVANNGPCAATNVRATLNPSGSLSFVDVSAECTNGAAAFAKKNRCELGTVAVGAAVSFTATYSVGSFPKTQTGAAIPTDVTVASLLSADETVAAVDDPNAKNDSQSTQASVSLNNGGCSTGGAGTLLALLPLAALRFRRRAK